MIILQTLLVGLCIYSGTSFVPVRPNAVRKASSTPPLFMMMMMNKRQQRNHNENNKNIKKNIKGGGGGVARVLKLTPLIAAVSLLLLPSPLPLLPPQYSQLDERRLKWRGEKVSQLTSVVGKYGRQFYDYIGHTLYDDDQEQELMQEQFGFKPVEEQQEDEQEDEQEEESNSVVTNEQEELRQKESSSKNNNNRLFASSSSDDNTKKGDDTESSSTLSDTKETKRQYQHDHTFRNAFEEDRRQAAGSVAAAVRKVGPSVVRIDTKRFINNQRGGSMASPFGNIFDDFDQREELGQGSGIIFSSDGYILTNAHVVNKADEVMVSLTDGRRYRAEVTGSDELVDIAVLKLKCNKEGSEISSSRSNKLSSNKWRDEPLPVAKLGDSENIEVGEWVIAVGNPVGLDNTVTMGIISSVKRSADEVGIPNKKVAFIQTDAAINPGNSGGPLVNSEGEIIGINTCIRANAEGIGFAIPVNKIKTSIHRLSRGENIEHGFVGINVVTITPDLARQSNKDPNSAAGVIPEVYGAMVSLVRENAPAAECGLRRYDIIIDVGGNPVKSASDVITIFDEAAVGKGIDVKIIRNNKEMSLTVVPEDLTKKMKEASTLRGGRGILPPNSQYHQRHSHSEDEDEAYPGQPGESPRIFIMPLPR